MQDNDLMRFAFILALVLPLAAESRDRGSQTGLEAVTIAAQAADVTVCAATYSAVKTAFTSKAPLSAEKRTAGPQTTPESEAMGTAYGAPPSLYNPVSPKLVPAQKGVDLPAVVGELRRMALANTTQLLAAGTGGTAFPFTRQKGLESALQMLGAELHSQYALSFAPEDSAPGYHKLEVSVGRGGSYRIRARPGYWSAEPK